MMMKHTHYPLFVISNHESNCSERAMKAISGACLPQVPHGVVPSATPTHILALKHHRQVL
jgi:hypothetical protein